MGKIENSKAAAYVRSKAWAFRTTEDHMILEVCPICGKDNWHFYVRFTPVEKDGLWDCKVCGENGNLYQLKEFMGDRMDGAMSMKDVATAGRQPEMLPDAEAAHRRLIVEAEGDSEETALDYLLATRGYTMEVIERFKLGVVEEYGKKWLLIPYYHNGNLVYAKYRTLPPAEKEFRGLSGRECPLFNQDVIKQNMEELIFVEGEGDALACLSNGVENVVGVPGANIKKAAWIKRLDDMAPKKIYLLYDNDKVGQEAAKEMALRIGLDKCYNIVLPKEFEGSPVKDVNDWFQAQKIKWEDESIRLSFEALKANAKPFAVDGVQGVGEIVQEIRDDIIKAGGTLKPSYEPRSPSLKRLIGGFERGDLVGIMAEGKVGKTTWAMNLLDELSVDYDEPAFLFCQEMTPKRLVRKWISCVTETDDDKITTETVDQALTIAADRKADFLFGKTNAWKFAEIADTIRQAVRRYGVRFVCFDNLQMLCRNIEHSVQETSILTKQFKQLAMELGIVIFLIIQPHRVKDGEIVAARNAMGSSAIEKDVDIMLCCHRNRKGKISQDDFASTGFLEVDENFEPQFLVRADLTRFANGGAITLWFDGAKSKVTEFPANITAAQQAMMGAPAEMVEA